MAAFAERTVGCRGVSVAEGYLSASVGELSLSDAQLFGVGMAWAASESMAEASMPSQTNTARLRFVPRERIAALMDECPSNEWRLLIALSRFGGLHCPSEHMALRWEDIDWARSRITVTASKTEAHANKETRIVPLFPEILPHLLRAFEEADPGTEFVISDRYRRKGVNLGTQLKRFIIRAGLSPWPRVWHNLRASCQTELSARFPLHVVCSWLGNTTTVATQHYLTVRESDFESALSPQLVTPTSRLQNALQHTAEMPRTASQTTRDQNEHRLAVQAVTTVCEPVHSSLMPPEGLEHLRDSPGDTPVSDSGGSKSGNTGAGFGTPTPPPTPPATPTDPELAAVVAAWSDLPPALRAGIVAMVNAAKPATPPSGPATTRG